MKDAKRNALRAQSADFLQSVVKKSQEKEDPATPQSPIVDTKKIEDITNMLKDKYSEKPKSKNYWEKKKA
jgi:hypothetical protein